MEIEEGVIRRGRNGALTCTNAAFLTSFPRETQNSSKFGHPKLVMVNYACALSQSESGKYFELIITSFNIKL